MTDAQKQNIEEMRRQGVGYKRIAGSLGLSENTIKSFCQRNRLESGAMPAVVEKVEVKPKCKQCGEPLEPSTRSKVFCNDTCRYSYWNANGKRRRSARSIVCACCGRVFTIVGNRNRKYCGHSCYITSRFKIGEIANDTRSV